MVMYTGKFNRCPGKEDMTDAQEQIKEKEHSSRNMGVGDWLSSGNISQRTKTSSAGRFTSFCTQRYEQESCYAVFNQKAAEAL